jgi:serine protease
VKKMAFFLSVVIMVSMGFAFAADQNPLNMNEGQPALVPDEVIVKFYPSVTDAKKNEIKVRYDLEKKKDSYKKGAFTVYKHRNPQAILSQLKHEAGVIYAEQNGYVYAVMTPDDDFYDPYQWNMTRIGMEEAWDISTGNGAIVAIIDTGVKQSLADLAETNFIAGYDFVNNDDNPTDDAGHGSHVCGTVAQSTNNNGIGVAGIAYNSTIMPVKVLNSKGSGTWDQVADGIRYAADNGADIINLSLGGTVDGTTLENAVNYAWDNGVVVVCAAGNSNSSAPYYPAYYANSIAVTATNYLDEKASYSNYGSWVDMSAPGGDSNDYNGDGYGDGILQNTFSRRSGDGYYFYTGTSMASPHVAGVAALVKACNPSLTNADVRTILETTAEDIGKLEWDQYFGNGIVDAFAAALQACGGNQPPVADFIYSVYSVYGVDGQAVDFTDRSADSDGAIDLWEWDFGDDATSLEQNPSHIYGRPGTYSVTLTATDEEGATGSVTKNITIGTIPDIYVSDIAMSIKRVGRNYTATAVITIMDTNDNVVPNATVDVTWSGVVSGSASGVTGAAGTVTFNSAKVKSTGPFTIRVTNVTHATMDYDSALNDETSDSITFDPVTR